jgi:hypothetical protein
MPSLPECIQVSNPFYDLEGPMESKQFDVAVEELVKRCSNK